MEKTSTTNKDIKIADLIALQQELADVKKEYGVEEKEGRISALISRYFEKKEMRQEIPLSRKKYILLAVFTGWMGGHRFYAKQYPMAILYLLFFWSGFPMAMTVIDLLIAIPKPIDENGNIFM